MILFSVGNNQPRKIGSVADIDPVNGVYGSMDFNNYPQQQTLSQLQQQMRYAQQQKQQHQQIQPNPQSAPMQQKPMQQKSISSQVVIYTHPHTHTQICLVYTFEHSCNENSLFLYLFFHVILIYIISVYSVPYTTMKLKIPMRSALLRGI